MRAWTYGYRVGRPAKQDRNGSWIGKSMTDPLRAYHNARPVAWKGVNVPQIRRQLVGQALPPARASPDPERPPNRTVGTRPALTTRPRPGHPIEQNHPAALTRPPPLRRKLPQVLVGSARPACPCLACRNASIFTGRRGADTPCAHGEIAGIRRVSESVFVRQAWIVRADVGFRLPGRPRSKMSAAVRSARQHLRFNNDASGPGRGFAISPCAAWPGQERPLLRRDNHNPKAHACTSSS